MNPAEVVPQFLNDPRALRFVVGPAEQLRHMAIDCVYGSAFIHGETINRSRRYFDHGARSGTLEDGRATSAAAATGSAAVPPWRFVTFAGGCKRHGPARMTGATGPTLTCLCRRIATTP